MTRVPHRGRWASLLLLVLALPVSAPVVAAAQATATAVQALPVRITDAGFWDMVSSISEPGGYFRITDNFTSNEGEIGVLFTELRQRGVEGGVYIGVGPEQNFTYMAAVRPQMAFIIDIRRQAVMQHLMFKALFELAPDRAEFISLLFARPRPVGLDSLTPIQQMWGAYMPTITDRVAALRTRDLIVEQLTKTHSFALTPDEVESLKYVYDAFVGYGPAIATRGVQSNRGGGASGYTFVDLTGWATDNSGQPRSFLSSEENFRIVKRLHERNLIVPVSGDFGGPKALRAIGAWIREHGATVNAYYVSNVEQYLFQDGKAVDFYDNAATLPVDERSVFIRPYSLRRQMFSESLCNMMPYLQAVRGPRMPGSDAGICRP